MKLKYKEGTLLRCIDKECDSRFFITGDVYKVLHSKRYPGNYWFEGQSDSGWDPSYIERDYFFEVSVIDNWAERMGDLK